MSKAISQEIHDKAAPFITWLEEAEEEESDSDDDGIEVMNHFNTRYWTTYLKGFCSHIVNLYSKFWVIIFLLRPQGNCLNYE